MQVLTSTKDFEMWGDGKQTRSFTYIDDCVEGILRVTKSDYKEPLNVGSSEMVRPSVPFVNLLLGAKVIQQWWTTTKLALPTRWPC
jgi:nucleoside-diphosphate-sugar epimerase